MKLVIEISEEDYERLKAYEKAPFCSLTSRVYEAVANGTPLPEHNGRLIDADAFLAWLIFKGYIDNATCGEVVEAIRKTTIIPATEEKSCENCVNWNEHYGTIDCMECQNRELWKPKQTRRKKVSK